MDGKCGICGSVMWPTASARFLKPQDFQKRLAERFGDYSRYFDREFDLNRVLSIPDFDDMLQTLSDFLRGRDMGKVVFMPRGWWIRCEHFFELGEEELAQFEKETSPVKFGSAEDAIKFLRANMLYGTAYEYYVMDEGLGWALTICRDMEVHMAGSKEFFDGITDYGDATIPEDPPVAEPQPRPEAANSPKPQVKPEERKAVRPQAKPKK